MATNSEPSLSNVAAMKETFIANAIHWMKDGKLINNYKFIVYQCEEALSNEIDISTDDNIVYTVKIRDVESVYRTYEKTYKTLDAIDSICNFDWFVRINISTFLNMRLLDYAILKLDKNCIYANALNSYVNADSPYVNDLYPRGDMFIFSDDIRKLILKHGTRFLDCDSKLKGRIELPHVDDCMIGLALIDGLGKNYYEHLKMVKYNFIPYAPKDVSSDMFNLLCIGSRVKTIPPGEACSGYSWDDNSWRRMDCEKMRMLMRFLNESDIDYSHIEEYNIIPKRENMRPTLFIRSDNANIFDVFHKILKAKR